MISDQSGRRSFVCGVLSCHFWLPHNPSISVGQEIVCFSTFQHLILANYPALDIQLEEYYCCSENCDATISRSRCSRRHRNGATIYCMSAACSPAKRERDHCLIIIVLDLIVSDIRRYIIRISNFVL